MRFDGRTFYVATTNAGKLRDFAAAGLAFDLPIEALAIVENLPEPVEDGETFEANARIKAEYYSRHAPGLWVLADDSGLEVDALDGAPGVRSARFAADEGYASEPGMTEQMTTDERNNACLLSKLLQCSRADHAGPTLSAARYRCVLALALDGATHWVAEGVVEGEIIRAPRGHGGFGYDPLFLIPELQRTMAEIDLAAKQEISHRGRALHRLLKNLR